MTAHYSLPHAHRTAASPSAALLRLAGAARYAGVLAVWFGLLLIRPRLALEILRHRRPDSPIPRLAAFRTP